VTASAAASAVYTLSALLEVQVEALALGAPVRPILAATMAALEATLGSLSSPPPPPVAPLVPEEMPLSAWDPEPHDVVMEASKCRALLLEIVRRAAHDWVLYRLSKKMTELELAEDAYVWMFEEDPAHSWARRREGTPKMLTSFLTICELLDLNPRVVRERVKKMTVKSIMTAGRPAERRRQYRDEPARVEDYSLVDGMSVPPEDESDYRTSYEAHFAIGM